MKSFKKFLPLYIALSFIVLTHVPVTNTVIIHKSVVESIKPFAGKIDGQTVGTEITCAYWLKWKEQPEIAKFKVTKPLGLGLFGYIYSATPIRV